MLDFSLAAHLTTGIRAAGWQHLDLWIAALATGADLELRDITAISDGSQQPTGVQYDTTVNRWHTSKNTARINASNPCSEYMFLDDSACNLASLNLMKFVSADGQFDVEAYRHAVDTLIIAQEILVDNAGYPTQSIMANSHDYRPL